MRKRWRIATYDSVLVGQLAKSASIPQVVAQLLVCRGIDCPIAARRFLDAKLNDLRDPAELPGVDAAAEILYQAVTQRKRIVIFGDYDADGMTGTAILLRCLRLLHADVRFRVPHRLSEGYGLNVQTVEALAAEGTDLLVTVDNGIASLAEADRAQQLGVELVVTDHHQVGERLPAAAAIVHPALPGSNYPFPSLCGAGVAFKLAWAVCQLASEGKRVLPAMRHFLLQATGLAAIGTVADVVPLIDENRVIVRNGLNSLSANPPVGIAALKQVTGLDRNRELTGEDLAFTIGPRLNAAGRMGQAELGIELLATDDQHRAAELASFIDGLNDERQTLERSVLLAARKQIKQKCNLERDRAIVLAGHGWHGGVIGIVAGKLVEQYHRPVVIISQDKLRIKAGMGSGRSIPGFDIQRALEACSDYLVNHGGHAAAAGLTIEDTQIDQFRDAFCEIAANELEADAAAHLDVDAEAPFAALTRQTLEQIDSLAPFGEGNRRPILCATEVRLAGEPRLIGRTGRHLAVDLEQHGVRLRAVAFGKCEWLDELKSISTPISIAFQPVLNRFRGRISVEMHLADWQAGSS